MAAPVQVPVLRSRRTTLATSIGPGQAIVSSARVHAAPSATYRIQLRPEFDFLAARSLVPFLKRIGITHVYVSPIFQARTGSPHGYDVVDPLRVNPELGGAEGFNAFVNELQQHGLGLILDIVPNHMAACAENPWWEDVLEEGPRSCFADYFDIDWQAAPPGCAGRLVLPVLGAPCGSVLENGELRLALDERGLAIRYWEHRFPLSLRSYGTVLSRQWAAWKHSLGSRAPAAGLVRDLLDCFESLNHGVASHSRAMQKRAAKSRLWRLYRTDDAVRSFLDRSIQMFSGEPGKPASFEWMDRLLAEQAYVLRYWRTGRDEVNYRRFFDINELAAVRVEDEEVFGDIHSLVFRLVREGKVAGLRIDHVDGLYDPAGYLERLEDCLSAGRKGAAPYVVVEKVLLGGEKLAAGWRACGTTGYDFLNMANGAFVDASNMPRLDSIYSGFTGIEGDFSELVCEQKKRVMRELFRPELGRLLREFQELAAGDRYAREASAQELSDAVVELTARLRVYRTYVRSYDVSDQDRKAIEAATFSRPAALSGPAGRFLRRVLLLECPDYFCAFERDAWLRFTMHWQQFTGPVMAKGMEDTACYIYNRLVSLNTVGGDVRPVSIQEFHRFNSVRTESCPLSLNATSTHDTKRSEDVAARISVLSEVPDLWEQCLARWSNWNLRHKRALPGGLAPSANDEILLYQVLLGAWPLNEHEVPEFRERVRGFVVKAAREAKVYTNWISPDAQYEEALVGFVDALLAPRADNCFLRDFLAVQARIAPFGAVSSLAKALLKITCPGVPDIYQGTLLWDFSLVDPDNRRPVDFARRIRMFEDISQQARRDRRGMIEDLVANWQDGRIKLYTIARALEHRREQAELFLSGSYTALDVSGPGKDHVIAFARRSEGRCSVVVVPRLLVSLSPEGDPLTMPVRWLGTEVRLPERHCWRNVFTNEVHRGYSVSVADVLGRFPVALLSGVSRE